MQCGDRKKAEFFEKYIKGKRVLDIGFIGNRRGPEDVLDSLHGQICRISDECVGLDLQTEKVQELQARGLKCVYGNAEDLKDIMTENEIELFDVVVAFELIEHILNQKRFLDGVGDALVDGGLLILSTPNPWALKHIIGRGMLNKKTYICDEHIGFFDELMMENLLRRTGWEIISIKYFPPNSAHPVDVISRLLYRIGLRRFLAAADLLVVAKRVE